ncbi:MAG: hypothetical protein EZS28_033455, partial [Streblomastix strix]
MSRNAPLLEQAFGTTSCRNSMFSVNARRTEIAHAVGCAVAIHSSRTGKLKHFLARRQDERPIQCLSFSTCGRFLAVGESGPNGKVAVWDAESKIFLRDLIGHKEGVRIVGFSHTMKNMK